MQLPLNLIFFGATETCPSQIILLVISAQTNNAIIQNTINRQPIESQEIYWERVTARALDLIEPYGHDHFIVVFCRNYPLSDHLSNDVMQNAARQQCISAANRNNHYTRAKALCTLIDHYNKPNFQL